MNNQYVAVARPRAKPQSSGASAGALPVRLRALPCGLATLEQGRPYRGDGKSRDVAEAQLCLRLGAPPWLTGSGDALLPGRRCRNNCTRRHCESSR